MNNHQVEKLVSDYSSGRITRRDFIKAAVALGLSASGVASLVASCAPAPTLAPPPHRLLCHLRRLLYPLHRPLHQLLHRRLLLYPLHRPLHQLLHRRLLLHQQDLLELCAFSSPRRSGQTGILI
jgi:hypothetical protein